MPDSWIPAGPHGRALRGRALIVSICVTLLTATLAWGVVGGAAADEVVPTQPEIAPTLSTLPAEPAAGGGATPAGVLAALGPVLTDSALLPPVSVLVADGTTGTVITDVNGSVPLLPASTLKLLTAVTALVALDDDGHVTTRVLRDPDGTVVLVGAGDPLLTLAPDPAAPGASLAELAVLTAARLRAEGVTEVPVTIDDSAFTGPVAALGWEESDLTGCLVRPITALALHVPNTAECQPDPDPALTAGAVFAELLAGQGLAVVGEVTRRQAAPAAPELAAAQSGPVSAMVEQMLSESDNTSAEMLAHLAGAAMADDPSFTGGVAATNQVLRDLGIDTTDLVIFDGSGLSLLDRMRPTTALAVLDRVMRGGNQQLWPTSSGLAVAGFDGTLAERFSTPETAAGRGDVRAKTGTLTGVSALSGQVVSKDGQLLTFVMISNGVADVLAAREVLDRAATALAECGCR